MKLNWLTDVLGLLIINMHLALPKKKKKKNIIINKILKSKIQTKAKTMKIYWRKNPLVIGKVFFNF